MAPLSSIITNPQDWDYHAKRHNVSSSNIYQLQRYDSASKIGDPQYLALRALWNMQDHSKFKPHKWGIHSTERARQMLRNLPHWKNYLRAVSKRVPVDKILPIRDDLGDFKHVWYHQQLIRLTEGTPDLEDNLKFTPVAKRTRALSIGYNRNLFQEAPKGAKMSSLTKRLRDVHLEEAVQEAQNESSSSSFEGLESPMDNFARDPDYKDEEETFPSVSDENVVNTGFVSFASVLTYSIEGVKAHWSQERKGFKVGEIDGIKLYEARTDGHLFLPSNKTSKVIIEVKPTMRDKAPRVRMQETAQMAAWIHVERDIPKGKQAEQKRYVT